MKRWTFDARWDTRGVHENDYMVPLPDGGWVRYHDAQRAAAEREREAFVAGVEWWGNVYKDIKTRQGRAEAVFRYPDRPAVHPIIDGILDSVRPKKEEQA